MTNPLFPLSAIEGSNGFIFNGINYFDFLGDSVSNAGDLNNDGFDDVIISNSPFNSFSSSSESYIIFGGNSFNSSLNPSQLNGSNGFVLNGINANDDFGASVSGAGDINGDGIDDIIIGAPDADIYDDGYYPDGNIYTGESYVIFGKNTIGNSGSFETNSLNGNNGFIIRGIDSFDLSGSVVSDAGDINSDGFDDVIIGADNANDYRGESYVVFGGSSFNTEINLSELDGSNGFKIDDDEEFGYSGISVSGAGDVNHDGFDDIIIDGAVVFGGNSFDANVNLSELNGNNGFIFDGNIGPVSRAGDVNNDGIDDVITGKSIVFGSNSFDASVDLSELDGSNGFIFNGEELGAIVNAGDVNGDGVDDIIIGAPDADVYYGDRSGKSYIVFGKNSIGNNGSFDLNSLEGSEGFIIEGLDSLDSFGDSVSSAGDVNGDGVDDLIIGVPNVKNSNGDFGAGAAYVIFGVAGNRPPLVAREIIDRTVNIDRFFSFQISNNIFQDVEGDILTYGASLADDASLPSWLNFDSDTLTFSGTPTDTNLGTIELRVTATDPNNAATSQTFTLDITDTLFPAKLLPGDVNSNGLVINGIDIGERAGFAVSSARDFNGDGIDDAIIGTRNTDNDLGENYVIFGSNSFGTNRSIELSNLDGNNGLVIQTSDRRQGVESIISNAGDINADGFDDIIIGSSSLSFSNKAYVVFGSNNNLSASLDLADLDGNNGFTILGVEGASNGLGRSVSNAGDINSDGIDDLIISAPRVSELSDLNNPRRYDDEQGETYVIFGDRNGFDPKLDLDDLDGSNGFVVENPNSVYDYLGLEISNAGDINGDGFDDIIIGAKASFPSREPQFYAIFGSDRGFDSSLNLADLDGNNGFVINSSEFQGYRYSTVSSVSNAGDINGDGFDDIIIGSDYDGEESYIVFGSNSIGNSGNFNLSDLDGNNGFVIQGNSSDNFVSDAGDLNGDGFDDIIISESEPLLRASNNQGKSYVVFGGSSIGSSGDFNLSELDGNNGFIFEDSDSGNIATSIGDFNKDGVEDIIIGAPNADPNGNYNAGESYVIFGRVDLESENRIFGTAQNDILDGGIGKDTIGGNDGNDTIDGGVGKDTINGGVGNDSLSGGMGKDLLLGKEGNDSIAGNDGNDTINGHDGADRLDGDTGNDLIYADLGNDTINGGAGVDSLLGAEGNDAITGDAGDDTINGHDGADIIDGGSGSDLLVGSTGNDSITGGDGSDRLYGQDDFDFLAGDAGDDTINGHDGADTIDGGSGSDLLVGSMGNDSITGGDGSDRLYGQDDDDLVNGGMGNDTINGGAGNDSLFGSDGNDIIYGSDGNDSIDGSWGRDVLLGEAGSDVFKIQLDIINDVIIDFEDGLDRLQLARDLNFSDLNFLTVNNNTIIRDRDDNVLSVIQNIDSSLITQEDFVLI